MSILTAFLASHLRTPHLIPRNIRWRMPRTVSDLRLVFVVGAPRSGTTLIQRVLASHSELFSIEGETGIFSARSLFGRNHFMLSTEDSKALLSESCDIVDFFSRGASLLQERCGGGIFVEKTPQHIKRIVFLMKHFPNAHFVHIVRDGRDCFCSAQSHPNIPVRTSISKFARYWRTCIRAGIQAEGQPAVHTFKYENFTANPEPMLTELMASLHLSPEAAQLDPTKTGQDQRSSLTHFKRLTSPISNETVGRWEREMTPAAVDTFNHLAGPELRHHGYVVRSGS